MVWADLAFVVTALVYLAASAAFGVYLVGGPRSQSTRFGTAAPFLLCLGACMHAAHIGITSFVLRVCPVESAHFAMSVLAVVVAAAYLFVRRRFQVNALGAVVAPLALTFLLASRFAFSRLGESANPVRRVLLPFHIAANVLGIALFTLAFAAALAYLFQERQLKRKEFGGLFRRLPPLDALDRAEHQLLLAGFPLLTLGILTGTVWARGVEVGDAASIARAIFGYASWTLFAAVLLVRAAAGWRGRRAAYGIVVGYGFTMVVILIYLLRPAAALP
jgi:ABC-type uncharacterized transport system permease subunit